MFARSENKLVSKLNYYKLQSQGQLPRKQQKTNKKETM